MSLWITSSDCCNPSGDWLNTRRSSAYIRQLSDWLSNTTPAHLFALKYSGKSFINKDNICWYWLFHPFRLIPFNRLIQRGNILEIFYPTWEHYPVRHSSVSLLQTKLFTTSPEMVRKLRSFLMDSLTLQLYVVRVLIGTSIHFLVLRMTKAHLLGEENKMRSDQRWL